MGVGRGGRVGWDRGMGHVILGVSYRVGVRVAIGAYRPRAVMVVWWWR